MKKIICLLLVLIMSLSLAAPVFAAPEAAEEAAENVFVPSIGAEDAHKVEIVPVKDKDGNDVIGIVRDKDGNEVGYLYDNDGHGCLMVTPVAHTMTEEIIKEKGVPANVVELLQFVFTELKEERMEIPYEKHGDVLKGKRMIIRDLFDARWVCDEHLPPEGTTFEIKFDLGVKADQEVFVMSYDEATKEWDPIVKTVNNGDGTVTCTFAHLCAIEFSVIDGDLPVEQEEAPAKEEDPKDFPWIWILILVLVIIAIIVIIIISKKNSKKNKKAAA